MAYDLIPWILSLRKNKATHISGGSSECLDIRAGGRLSPELQWEMGSTFPSVRDPGLWGRLGSWKQVLVKGSQSPNGRAGSSRDKGTAATSHFFRDPQPNSSAIKIPFKKRSKVGAGGGSIYTKKMVAVLTQTQIHGSHAWERPELLTRE